MNLSLDFAVADLELIPDPQIKYSAIPARGLSLEACRRSRYGVSEYKGVPCHVASWTDASGTVVAQKIRLPDKKFVILGDSSKMGLWGLERVREGGRRIYITEGELDSVACYQALDMRWPVVSLPNGASSAAKAVKRDLKRLEMFDEVVLVFDEDEPGRKAVEECVPLFAPGKVLIARLSAKDACDMTAAGRHDALRDHLYGAEKYRPESLVTGSQILEAIRERKAGEPDAHYPFKQLDSKLLGVQKKRLVLVTGGTGSGKSTFSGFLAASLLTQGKSVGYLALEESVDEAALRIFGSVLGERLLDKEEQDLERIGKLTQEYDGKFFLAKHFGSLEVDPLVSLIRHMAVGQGCEFIFLDHISIVVSGLDSEDERQAIDRIMTRLRTLVEQTGVGLFVICHLRRASGTSHEEGAIVRLSHLRGSHGLAQIADIVIALNRDQDSEDDNSDVYVLKSRWAGRLGPAGTIHYDHSRATFTEVQTQPSPISKDF